ncbi:hypothetical protein FHX42_002004 [Saccharopolyspora lacisalsi]|uniref:Uncharacterized protein n=1 Tax=Halosaccharopolyspora lacisalsi TaxID=1000566 RepID=A0A839DYU2_9PSEU|nr:hypothetical protein [Halosaccharopolyspora lacisalsi]MBA8824657.1 hypothetical protein [Halosaccharopolyspora lacisalsi]
MFKVNLVPEIKGPKPPVNPARSDLRNCVTFPNPKTLRHQFDCHALGNFTGNDPAWTLESDREPNGDWWNNVRQHKCNWGHGDGGSSS